MFFKYVHLQGIRLVAERFRVGHSREPLVLEAPCCIEARETVVFRLPYWSRRDTVCNEFLSVLT